MFEDENSSDIEVKSLEPTRGLYRLRINQWGNFRYDVNDSSNENDQFEDEKLNLFDDFAWFALEEITICIDCQQ